MTNPKQPTRKKVMGALAALAGGLLLTSCGDSHDHDHDHGPTAIGNRIPITNSGSSTMLDLAVALAGAYSNVAPGVVVLVEGVGSTAGIAALTNGACNIANSSRPLEKAEIVNFKTKQPGKEPKEFMVSYDSLTLFVHKDNPLEEISLEELQQLYMKDGTISKWSELGVKKFPDAKDDQILLVSRAYMSATYQFFREVVVGEGKEVRSGTMDMESADDAVELVAATPNAIGYSRMGVATPRLKYLKISGKKGEKALESPITAPLDTSYPLLRSMFMYAAGEPAAHVRKYLDWILSDSGQKIAEQAGYVRLPKK